MKLMELVDKLIELDRSGHDQLPVYFKTESTTPVNIIRVEVEIDDEEDPFMIVLSN